MLPVGQPISSYKKPLKKWCWRRLKLKINCTNKHALVSLLLKNKELLLRFLHDIYSDHLVHFLPCACYKILKNFTYEIIECLQYFQLLLSSNLTIRNHSFSTYAKFSEKLTFLTPWYETYVWESGGKKWYFSENFAYVLNE